MNRLQKKCFIASTGLHVLLVLILVIAPALGSKSKMEEMPTIDFIPNKLIDAAFSGGGTPNTRPPPPAPPTPPAPAPPQREVAPPDPKPDPKPEVVKPKDPEPPKEIIKPKPVAESFEVAPKPKKPKIEITTKAVSRTSDSQKKEKQKEKEKADADARAKELADARAKEAAETRRRQEIASAIGSATSSLKSDLKSVPIDVNPGPGGGGETYANYAQVVKSIYERSWIPSDDTTSDEAITKVSVTIRRDGSVASARIIKRCGDASIDQSVQRTLDRVKFIAPFPEGAKDQERTFTINFNLKAKRMMG